MIWDSISDLLPGLLPASFRGVQFFVPDASTMPGRRVAEYLFPGIDQLAYDDFGLSPLEISITGMIVSDAYIGQAAALQRAFERPGPGTLVHPWLGAMTVILPEPAEISFSASELRVARFTATFKRVGVGGSRGAIPTASDLIAAASGMSQAAAGLARAVSTTVLSQSRALATRRSSRMTIDTWRLVASAAPSLRSSLPEPTADPAAFAVQLSQISDAVLALVPALTAQPAVSPSAEFTPPAGVSARVALAMAIDCAGAVASSASPSAVDTALLTASAASAIATASRLSAAVTFASRQEAAALRGSLTDRLDAVGEVCATLSVAGFAAPASLLLRATGELRFRLVADINEAIGRLAVSSIFTADQPTDVFELAHHSYGDDPSSVERGYQTIVTRNRPRHPASIPAGPVEILR